MTEFLYLIYGLGLFAAVRTLATLMQQERTIEQHRFLVELQNEQIRQRHAEIEQKALAAMAAVAMPADPSAAKSAPTSAKKAA